MAKVKRDLRVLGGGTETGMLEFNCMESILFNRPEYSVITLYTVPNTQFLTDLTGPTVAEKPPFRS